MADILPDSHFVENLYQKNQNLFERVLNKLKEFVKNVREYFAHVNPNTKLEVAVLKENTESGMRYLEKIVEAFDKTAEAAAENYQQAANVTESTAESRTQYKTRGKYWRPNLKGSEWQLLERRMAQEIGSRENFLDEATKWVYAEEKGVQVFALYGIRDGTDATPLYAVGGEKAAAYNAAITKYSEVRGNGDESTVNFSRWIKSHRSSGVGQSNSVLYGERRRSDGHADGGVHSGSQRDDGGGTAGRGAENQRGVKEKFSLRDSAGRELTEAQQAYFKDSKVRDADGNLKPVYHGSAAIFTEFSADFMSQNGSSEGQGFYFTDYKPMAQGYEKNGGQLLEGYLDIKKPLSDSEVTLTAAEVKRLIQAVDPTGDDLVLNYDSRGGIGYPSRAWYNRSVEDTLRATMSTSDSDSEILAELANGMGDPGKVLKTVRELLGYDGYIVEGKYDDATVYVAFDSSQFKNADNKTPTADPDIRYSLREVGGKVMPVLDVQNDTRDYKVAEAYLKTLVDTEHPFATILVDAQPVYIGKDLPGEYKSSEYTKSLRKTTRAVKMQAATNLDEMLLLAENGEWRENVKDKHKKDAKNGWYRYSTRFALPVLDIKKAVDHYTVYSGTLLIRNDADGKSYLYDLLDIKKEKVISSTSFSAQGRSEVFEPKPSREQYMRNSRESQAENTGNDRHALRDVAMSDRDVLRRAADLALSDRKMNFTQADRERLKIFKKRLDILDEKQTQRQGYLQAKRDILSNSARLF